jgi:exosortase F-associated protein
MFKKIAVISILLFFLILVRVFESDMFYDPFLQYFKSDYLISNHFPQFSWTKMIVNLVFRYFINTAISLSIIYVAFKDKSILKFSIYFYLFSLLILISIYSWMIINQFEAGYLPAFYVRRFIIQPLFVFLLIPGFLYQKRLSNF